MTQKQAVLRLLSDKKPHTHHELYALGCVAHSRISDLRADGHDIDQWRHGKTYLYQLRSTVALNEGSVSDPVSEAVASVSAADPSLSVPAAAQPLAEPSASTVSSSSIEDSAGTLSLFACEIDESAGLRGAYGDAA